MVIHGEASVLFAVWWPTVCGFHFPKSFQCPRWLLGTLAIPVNRKGQRNQKAHCFYLRTIPKSCIQAFAREAGRDSFFFLNWRFSHSRTEVPLVFINTILLEYSPEHFTYCLWLQIFKYIINVIHMPYNSPFKNVQFSDF